MSNEEQQRYLDNITVKAETLIEALPYIRDFNSKKVVVKYGGSAMLDHNLEESVIKDVALLKLVGMQPIIVHGGGKEISKWISKVGKETRFEEGFRVTDKDTMEIAEMVLNRVNKNLVSMVEHLGVKAIGLCGKDGGIWGPRKKMATPINSASTTEQRMPNRTPFFTRSYCRAPRFCPTKVDRAMAKQVMGRKAKPSTLE